MIIIVNFLMKMFYFNPLITLKDITVFLFFNLAN